MTKHSVLLLLIVVLLKVLLNILQYIYILSHQVSLGKMTLKKWLLFINIGIYN